MTKTLTLAAKTQVAGKVGAVLLANNASTGADPSSEITHDIAISISGVGVISVTSVNGVAGQDGNFALRPAAETTTPEASMPSGGYTDGYVSSGQTANQFFEITAIA